MEDLKSRSPIFSMKYGKLNARKELHIAKHKDEGNCHYVDVGGEWERANSYNTLPSASYFGMLYSDMISLKQVCFIASHKNSILAEQMYNEMEYIKVIEYYIISLSLKII